VLTGYNISNLIINATKNSNTNYFKNFKRIFFIGSFTNSVHELVKGKDGLLVVEKL